MTGRFVVAGIDGGASSTTCIIADETGRVLGMGHGGPVDHVYREAGQRQTRASLQEAVRTAVRQARLRDPVRVVVAGLTGLEPDSPESRTAVRIIRSVMPARIVRATWDAEIAFIGASGGGPGVMVIAGTGSVALGRNASGHTARAGGYGYLIDDAGGGVSIGQAALRAAMLSADRRGPRTRLETVFRTQLGEWPEMRRCVYGEGGGRALLASLVPIVVRSAQRKDGTARRILEEAGRSLGGLAVAVAHRLRMLNERFELFLVGGVFAAGRLVLDPLREVARSAAPQCVIRPPRYPPAVGAVLMAYRAAGIEPGAQVLRRLQE